MSSTSETGHAVNIANFKLLIDKSAGFGAVYNPSTTRLTIPTMTIKWTSANGAQTTINTALQNSKGPINAREILFEPLSKGVTKIINYLNSTDATKQVKKDAKGLADKIRGIKHTTTTVGEGGTTEETVSQSHQSFVMRADTFKQLVELLKTIPEYDPNEDDKKIVNLDDLYTAMKTANDAIGTIIAPVEAARIARNHALYDDETGMVDVALACKKYVKSVFGATAMETKTVTKIKFKRPGKKIIPD